MAEAERLCQILDRVKSAGVANSTSALLILAEALIETYTQLKADRSRLDYDDLILAAQHLLTKDGVAPWVLFKLDGGLDHILIDEAQDTNPEQWQVVAALAEEFFANAAGSDRIRTLFAVGDEKQSIYSFQRADPAEFARMRGHFQSRVETGGRPLAQDRPGNLLPLHRRRAGRGGRRLRAPDRPRRRRVRVLHDHPPRGVPPGPCRPRGTLAPRHPAGTRSPGPVGAAADAPAHRQPSRPARRRDRRHDPRLAGAPARNCRPEAARSAPATSWCWSAAAPASSRNWCAP